jgi:hypothetical protein
MALVAFEGFDHYGASPTDVLNRRASGLQWNSAGNGNAWVTPGRNNAGTAIRIGPLSYLLGALTVPQVSGYFGFAMLLEPLSIAIDGAYPFLRIWDLGRTTIHLDLLFNLAAGSLQVFRGNHQSGGVLVGSTGNNAYTVGTWNFIEFFLTISDTTGAVQIRNNGQLQIGVVGIDTKTATGFAQFDGIEFFGANTGTMSNGITIDDLYVADTTVGPGLFPFNYFAGDSRVVTLHAVGDVGTPGWTPLSNANWQEISEVHADGDASYNTTASVGAADRFNFEALSGTISNVLAVQVTGSYRKDDAGTRIVTQLLDSGGTEVGGAGHSIPNEYVYPSDLFVLDPATGATWSVTAVNAVKAGYVLSA